MKTIKILFTICLLIVGGQAFSQDGANPFLNSTHTYTVNGGAAGNYQWSVLLANGNGAPPAEYTLVDETTAAAKITWLKVNDASNANYIVQLEQTNGNSCSTIRQFEVTVIGNIFDIAIADLTASCSDASGSIIVDATNSNLGTTSKTFIVNMKTQPDMTSATFIPDWKFNYEVTSTNGDLQSVTPDATNTVVTSAVVNPKSATGVVTVNNADYTIQLIVVFNNTWNKGDVITVTLSNGIELTYNTPDGLSTNNEGSVVINALPDTTNITTN